MAEQNNESAASNGADPAAATAGDGVAAQLAALKSRAEAAEKTSAEYLELAQRAKATRSASSATWRRSGAMLRCRWLGTFCR
jgi:hypothetical protein